MVNRKAETWSETSTTRIIFIILRYLDFLEEKIEINSLDEFVEDVVLLFLG